MFSWRNYYEEKLFVENIGLTDDEKELIYYKNAKISNENLKNPLIIQING